MPRLALPFLAYLLVACSQGASEPDRVRFEPSMLDLGGLRAGEARRIPLFWRRSGAGPLRVLAFEGDCGCASPGGLRGRLAPGTRGTAWVRLKVPARPGPLRQRLRLYTDARPPFDCECFTLRGWIGGPAVLRPASLDLGSRSPGACVAHEIEMLLAPHVPAQDLRLTLRGLAGAARLVAPLHRDAQVWRLRLVMRAPAGPGAFSARLEIGRNGRLVGALPIVGVVALAAAVDPASRPPSARPDRAPPR